MESLYATIHVTKSDADLGITEYDIKCETKEKFNDFIHAINEPSEENIRYTYTTTYYPQKENVMNNLTHAEAVALIEALEAHLKAEDDAFGEMVEKMEEKSEELENLEFSDLNFSDQEHLISKWLRHNDESLQVGSWSISLEELVEDGNEELKIAIADEIVVNDDGWAEDTEIGRELAEQIYELEEKIEQSKLEMAAIENVVSDLKQSPLFILFKKLTDLTADLDKSANDFDDHHSRCLVIEIATVLSQIEYVKANP